LAPDAVDLGLGHPGPKRLLADAELSRDSPDQVPEIA
jgi:hypothetical protein